MEAGNQWLADGSRGDGSMRNARISDAVPRQGHVLAAVAERVGAPVRRAVAELEVGLQRSTRFSGMSTNLQKRRGCVERAPTELAAWNLVAKWLVAVASGGLPCSSSLAESEAWFGGSSSEQIAEALDSRFLVAAEQALPRQVDPKSLGELLPYVLDPHGQANRLTVRSRPETRIPRATKRERGVYYTPEDVADFMVRQALSNFLETSSPGTVLDLACGTGVFLRAALKAIRARDGSLSVADLVCASLFGVDIDPWAIDAAVYVLLLDSMEPINSKKAPSTSWRRIRKNFACIDALLIDPARKDDGRGVDRVGINRLFKGLREGPTFVVGNPPYADLGPRDDLLDLAKIFETLSERPRGTANLYPLFIEQMVRLARPDNSAGAFVVPLSIAVNSGRQFVALRRLIGRTPGVWRFAFFDREPHALFGEDVKTRNATVFWSRAGAQKCTISTGPLRKWRGGDRAKMLESIDYTPLAADISSGIPKIEGAEQAAALNRVIEDGRTAGRYIATSRRVELRSVPDCKEPTVFVGATAYNFLNVFQKFEPTKFAGGLNLSEHPAHALHCASQQDADVLFAILSSCVAFWWWHCHDDGFHVSKETIATLPVGNAFSDATRSEALARLGRMLWERASANPIMSKNKGKVSAGFNAAVDQRLQRDIDREVVGALGLDAKFVDNLGDFKKRVVSADMHGKKPEKKPTTRRSPPSKAVSAEAKEKSKITKEEWREYTKTVWSIANTSHPDHPAVFPPEIPHRLVKLFSFYGETILDPFAGTGTTARAAIPLGRRVVCVDQNEHYVELIRKECARLRNGHGPGFEPLSAVVGDSRNLSFQTDNSVGLIVTSPPYWNKADYGSGAKNLGNVASYAGFLDSTRPVFEECFRVLMPGRKLCLVTANVNQHTDHGLLTFPLATDFAVLLRKLGFVMINEIIWSKDGTGGKWGSYGAQRPIFGSYPYPPNFLFKNVHEYILIFAKPSPSKTKGPKVKPYADLMAGTEFIDFSNQDRPAVKT